MGTPGDESRRRCRPSPPIYSVEYFEAMTTTTAPTTYCHRAELGSIELLPDGQGFVLALVTAEREVHRMQLPVWTVHQLMRLLPRLDASLLQAQEPVAAGLIAYPVVQWCVQPTGADRAVAMSLTSDQQVEAAYLFGAADARAIHAALGEAIAAGRG